MLKNVVFDVCNVLLEFDCHNFVYEVFEDKNIADNVKKALIDYDLWNQFDMGPESEEKIVDGLLAAYPKYAKEIKYAFDEAPKYLTRCDYPTAWIKELQAAGFKVYILSNYCRYMINARPDAIDFVPALDGGFFSCNIHMIKPHADIFEKLCEEYHLEPAECIFVDDRPDNIEAAKGCGWQGLVFTKYEETHANLKQVLGY